MNKILLTGATGFIGSQLLKNLSYKNKIYITLRKKKGKILKSNNIIKIYFNNFKSLNKKLNKVKVDTVIHCATHYVKHHNQRDIEKLSYANILFGNIILENLAKMKVKKFINFSTVWENYDGKKDNFFNLYSVYKKNFTNIIDFYEKKFNKIKFYSLSISDTFGEFDRRKKIINILRNNYKNNLITKIVSKNLYINLLNIIDIVDAIKLILHKNVLPGNYVLKNDKDYPVSKIIDTLNAASDKKIKVKWLSKKVLKEKIYKYKQLKKWRPNYSKIKDIVYLIKK